MKEKKEACCHFCGKAFKPQEEGYAEIKGEAQLVCMGCAEKIIDALKGGNTND